jgi:hypothetical protein
MAAVDCDWIICPAPGTACDTWSGESTDTRRTIQVDNPAIRHRPGAEWG